MPRIPAAIAVLGLSALTLVGCSSGPAAASCERADSDASVLGFVQTSGEFGTPAATLDAPVYVESTTFTDEVVGDGLRVTSDLQDVVFSVTLVNGATGEPILSSGTQVQPLSSWRENFDGLAQLMMCATEGSRVVGAIPATDVSEAAAQQLGVAEGQSIVATLDLQRVYLAAADGVPQYNDRRGMPSVVLAPDGRPGLIVPDVPAPTDQVVEVLKKGDGAVVAASDTVRVHYTGVNWTTDAVTSSTWEDGASQAIAVSSGPAFAGALVGATVGSQLLVVVPGQTEGDPTVAYVVDILGIDAAATQ